MTMPNWVKERAACTLENNFLTIEKSIKSDIKVFNRLAPKNRGERLFVVKNRDDGVDIRRAKRIDDHRGIHLVVDANYDRDSRGVWVWCGKRKLLK